MSGPSQLKNTTFQSPSKANRFDGGVVLSSPGHTSFTNDTYDAFGAFGAPNPSLNEEKRTEFIESFLDNDTVLREFIKSTHEDNDNLGNIHDALPPASNTLSPNPFAPFVPPPHLTTPVEDSYWSELRCPSPSPSASVYSIDFGSDRSVSPDLGDRPFPEDQPELTLADIQVNRYSSGPFFGTADDLESSDAGEVVPGDPDYLSIVLAASRSPGSSSTASPLLPITPLDRHRRLGESRADPVQAVETANSVEEPAKDHCEDKSSPSSPTEELSPESHAEQEKTVSPVERVGEDGHAAEPGTENREESDDSNLSPVPTPAPTPTPTSEPTHAPPSENEVDQQVDNTPDAPVAGPSKRKRVIKSRPTRDLRELSRVPPQSKRFNIRGCFGRLPRTGTRKVLSSEVEAVSCCHLAGADGHCQFRGPAGGERCMVELPKNSTYARAHLNMHIDILRWLEHAQRDPNWRPVCPWCGEARTRLQQLLRHILDSHLLINVEWCPCGGTNSRANQKNNTGRHEDSEKHQAYLREKAGKEAGGTAKEVEDEDGYYEDEGVDENQEEMALISSEDEDEDEVQPEFVEGSSRGTKRRRLG